MTAGKEREKKYAAIVVPATAMISVILYYECISILILTKNEANNIQ